MKNIQNIIIIQVGKQIKRKTQMNELSILSIYKDDIRESFMESDAKE